MGAITYSKNGTATLLPYAMPYTLDEYGAREDYGRFVIAYSRDGWFVLDNDLGIILSWAVSEEDAVKIRARVMSEVLVIEGSK